MTHSDLPSKADLRQQVLTARRRLDDRAARSTAIAQRVQARLGDLPPQSLVLVYLSVRDEVDTTQLRQNLLQRHGQVVVPYSLPDYQLGLYALQGEGELQAGKYGILEPADVQLRTARKVSPEALDAVLLPGVAFDLAGNRLGYGKGYFDRLLAKLRPDCLRLALAFECQIVADVPTDRHDLPVQQIVTETRTLDCRPRS